MGIQCGRLACSASTASFVIHEVTIVCVSELCFYIYICCIISSFWPTFGTKFKVQMYVGPYMIAHNYFYLEGISEWHMARLLVRNGYWNTHATMRLDDYVLIHVDIILGSMAKHNVERDSTMSEGEGKIVFMALTSVYEFCNSTPNPKACKMTNFVICDG